MLPRSAGVFQSPGGKPVFSSFADTAPDRISTSIDLDDTHASIETALSVSPYFRLPDKDARALIATVERATADWRREAANLNLPRRDIDIMAAAFETDQRHIARTLAID